MKNAYFFFIASTLLFVTSGHVRSEPLKEVVDQVLTNYPDIRSAESLLEASDAQLWQTYSKFLPTLGATYQNGHNNDLQSTNNLNLQSVRPITRSTSRTDGNIQWNLFNGFSDWYSMRSAQFKKEAVESDLDDTREAVALRVTEQYIEALRLQAQLKITSAYLEKLQRLTDDVEKQVEVGKTSNVATLQAVAQVIQAEYDMAQLQGLLSGVMAGFKVMGIENIGTLSEPKFNQSYADQSLDQLLETATQSYKLQAALKRVDQSDADIGVATGAMLPDVTITFRQRLQHDISPPLVYDTQSAVNLQVNYQLPLGGETYSKRVESVARKSALVAQADQVVYDIKTQLGDLQQQLIQAKAMVPHLIDYVDSTKAVVEAYELQFDAGKHSLIDFLIVQKNLFDAERTNANNHFEQLVYIARIGRQIGSLQTAILQVAPMEKSNKN